jgi:hypothetical protein
MAELKTKPTAASVEAFLTAVPGDERRADCLALAAMMREATRAEPKMWGPAIVGFGDHHYRYASGREGDWFMVGFSPRKGDLSIYLTAGLDHFAPLLAKLGKHKRGKGCLYVRRLADVDTAVLRELVDGSVAALRRMSGSERPGA